VKPVNIPGENLLLIGGWKRAFFEQRQSVKCPHFDECANEEGRCLKHSVSTSTCQILGNEPFPSIQWVVQWVPCPCLPLRPSSPTAECVGIFALPSSLQTMRCFQKQYVPLASTMKKWGDIILQVRHKYFFSFVGIESHVYVDLFALNYGDDNGAHSNEDEDAKLDDAASTTTTTSNDL